MCLRFIFNRCAICPAPDWWLCVRHGPVPVRPRCPLAVPAASADFVFPLSPRWCSQADSQVDLVRQHFYEVSLEYVFKVQEVQERKMFEFVEPVSERSALPVPQGGVLGDAVPRSQGSAAPRGVWGRQCLPRQSPGKTDGLDSFYPNAAAGLPAGAFYLLPPRLRACEGFQ